MYDPMTVVFDLRRPPLTPRELRGKKAYGSKQQDRRYRHRQIGFLNIRASRSRCAHCDDGRVQDPPPSYHANAGYYPGQECPDCRGRGYNGVSITRRLYLSFAFFRLGGREWYLPSLVTIWHVDPEKPTPHGRTDDSCRADVRRRQLDAYKDGRGLENWLLWKRYVHMHKWHVHHWKIQVRPLGSLRRWLFTRCAGCGERLPFGYSPVSGHWDAPPHKWYESEVGVYHHECYSKKQQPEGVARVG